MNDGEEIIHMQASFSKILDSLEEHFENETWKINQSLTDY